MFAFNEKKPQTGKYETPAKIRRVKIAGSRFQEEHDHQSNTPRTIKPASVCSSRHAPAVRLAGLYPHGWFSTSRSMCRFIGATTIPAYSARARAAMIGRTSVGAGGESCGTSTGGT